MTRYHIVAICNEGCTHYFAEASDGTMFPTESVTPYVVSEWTTLKEAKRVLTRARKEFVKQIELDKDSEESLPEWHGLLNSLSLASLCIIRTVTLYEELRDSKWIEIELKSAR